jgi:ribonuclease T1
MARYSARSKRSERQRFTMRWIRIALLAGLAVAAAGGWLSREAPRGASAGVGAEVSSESVREWGPARTEPAATGLPVEARQTLRLIAAGGPFPYDRDGMTFQNRERRLPAQPPGYYREYTVLTPGSPDRGARRIVSGGNPPVEFYYTDDHYRSFRQVEVPRP